MNAEEEPISLPLSVGKNVKTSIIELYPVIIPYLIGFFLYRGLQTAFPIYLQLKFHYSEQEVVTLWGNINGVVLLVGALTRVPAGLISNALGRKSSFYLGYFVNGIAVALLWAHPTLLGIMIGISMIRFAVNMNAMTGRAIVSSLKSEEKGLQNGILTGATGLGGFLGASILTGVLDVFPADYMMYFAIGFLLADFLLFISSTTLLAFLTRNSTTDYVKTELHSTLQERISFQESLDFSSFKRKEGIQSLILFFMVGVIIGFINSVYSIYGYNVLHLSPGWIGLFVGLASIGQIIWPPFLGKLLRIMKTGKVIHLAMIGILFTSLCLLLSPYFLPLYLIAVIILNISTSSYFTADITRMSYYVPKNGFSLFFGVTSSMVFIGSALASFLTPYTYTIDSRLNFFIGFIGAFILVLLNFFLFKDQRQHEPDLTIST